MGYMPRVTALFLTWWDVSDYFVSRNGDGFYFVKLTAKAEGKVSYASIWVRFKWLDDEMAKIRKEGRIKERIDLNVRNDDGDAEPEEKPEDAV